MVNDGYYPRPLEMAEWWDDRFAGVGEHRGE